MTKKELWYICVWIVIWMQIMKIIIWISDFVQKKDIEDIRRYCNWFDFYYETWDIICKELRIYDDIELSLKEQTKTLIDTYNWK